MALRDSSDPDVNLQSVYAAVYNEGMTKPIPVRLTQEQVDAIAAAAKKREISSSEWIRRVVDRGLAGEAKK